MGPECSLKGPECSLSVANFATTTVVKAIDGGKVLNVP
jgi:hypothetical protein